MKRIVSHALFLASFLVSALVFGIPSRADGAFPQALVPPLWQGDWNGGTSRLPGHPSSLRQRSRQPANLSIQNAPHSPLWQGGWYGNRNNPADRYTYNDAILSTGAHRLHGIGITGYGLTTAVIDSDFNTGHEIYQGKIVNGFDDLDVNPPGRLRHGAHVSGIVLSMAPGSQLWLAGSTGGADESTAALFRHIAELAAFYNIAALNNSWGDVVEGQYADSEEVVAKYPDSDKAARLLREAGIVVLVASGNNTVNGNVGFPDGLPTFLTVGALGPNGEITAFSSLPNGLFLLAPGENIYSATGPGNNYTGTQGTSMASPHVAGAVTLLKSGARNATASDIISALHDAADRIVYNGNAIISNELFDNSPNFHGFDLDPASLLYEINNLNPSIVDGDAVEWLQEAQIRYGKDALTLDDFRILNRIGYVINYTRNPNSGLDADDFEDFIDATDILMPLGVQEYGFLRVDKAYMLLTQRRMDSLANRVNIKDSGLGGMFRAYADELGRGLDFDTSQVFQRLDYWNGDTGVLTAVARQMSPRFVNATAESAHLGFVGLHRSLGRRGEIGRLAKNAHCPSGHDVSSPESSPDGPCVFDDHCDGKTHSWIEGIGSFFNKSGTLTNAGYDGHFAGTAFGLERCFGNLTFGGFAAWANHQVRGDGFATGNWAAFGAYGRYDLRNIFFEASLSYGYGHYDLVRKVNIPGAVFSNVGNAPDIVLDPMRKRPAGSTRAHNLAARGAAAGNVWNIGGWTLGPRGEVSLSHLVFDGYREDGGDSLNLAVNTYRTTYLEGGLGLSASRQFTLGSGDFTAVAKLTGMYGKMSGDDLSGRFRTFGSPFQVKAKHMSAAYLAPEAALIWNITPALSLSGSYSGRFGGKYSENSGSLNAIFRW